MRVLHVLLLALCCAWATEAALQYDYLNTYSCPPQRCLARKAMPKGFAGPAASYLECRPRGDGVEGGAGGAPTKPTVANAVYSPAPLSTNATAELCAPGALGDAAGGSATPAALLVVFDGGACSGAPRSAPVRLDGACRPAPPGAPKPFRRDTLLCVAGANATAEACDDAACAQGCQPVAPVATQANACRDGVLALCAALAPKA